MEVSTPRATIRARALVTSRIPSLDIGGKRVHQVGLPYHWGGRGVVNGDVVNDLLAISEEPNVRISNRRDYRAASHASSKGQAMCHSE